LSKLRGSAGESPIPLNALERIQAMIRDGRLPSGDICPYSGRPAHETMIFRVHCESPWAKGPGGGETLATIALGLCFGFIGSLIASRDSGPEEIVGRETTIDLPVRISPEARPELERLRSQKRIKAVLSQTPIYAQLLREFPEATVEPVKPNRPTRGFTAS